jgi:hypothetical protein
MPSTYNSRSGATGELLSPTSSESSSLPGNEYKRLQQRQKIERLNAYFEQPHLPLSYTSARPKTSYQQARIPRERRVEISEVGNATRIALGSNFDFTHESYRSQRSAAAHTTRTSERKEPIPQRYIDEFNNKWAEDDRIYEHQRQADYTYNADWRTHAGMHVDTKPLPAPRREAKPSYDHRPMRFDSSSRDEPRPLARSAPAAFASRFSLETREEPVPKRSFWGRFR